jgi:hypothetical protein
MSLFLEMKKKNESFILIIWREKKVRIFIYNFFLLERGGRIKLLEKGIDKKKEMITSVPDTL